MKGRDRFSLILESIHSKIAIKMEESTSYRPRGKQVQFMLTCLCDAFFDDVAKATVEVLEYLGCEVEFPEGQTCCGQPAFNAGDWQSARRVLKHTRDVFQGELPVILPSGSCASMMHHGPDLAFEGDESHSSVAGVGNRCWEICDYIVNGLGIERWPGSFNGKIAVHKSCHTRGTRSFESAMTLLSSIKGTTVAQVGELEQCCGFGGTFSVSFPHISTEMGQLKVKHLKEPDPDIVAALDMACMMHFGGMMEKAGDATPRMHVIQILRDSLKNEGLI